MIGTAIKSAVPLRAFYGSYIDGGRTIKTTVALPLHAMYRFHVLIVTGTTFKTINCPILCPVLIIDCNRYAFEFSCLPQYGS